MFKTPAQYAQTEKLIERFTELLDQTSISADDSPHAIGPGRATYVTAVLSIMELAVRQLTNARDGQVTVTFARYCDDGRKIDITQRNRGSQRLQKTVEAADYILAHRVCQTSGEERIVHDLLAFPERYRRSPTGAHARYRSFYIIPLGADAKTQQDIGFVSIDCEIPYAFHGNRAKIISAAIAPLTLYILARLQ